MHYIPGYYSVMVLPDLHLPHQDELALSCVLKAHRELKPKETVILGDWLDAGAFSAHPPKSFIEDVAYNFKEDEIDPCNKILDQLQKNTKTTIYIEGNHEHRVEKAAVTLGKSLASVHNIISPKNLLGANRKNFKWVPYYEKLSHYEITPDLWAFHGWSHAENAAQAHKKLLPTISGVFGHIHRAQEDITRNPATGDLIKTWSPGCLCKLQPLYQLNTPTKWVHGFTIIYVKNNKTRWQEYNIQIVNGSCILPNGKLIKG